MNAPVATRNAARTLVEDGSVHPLGSADEPATSIERFEEHQEPNVEPGEEAAEAAQARLAATLPWLRP